MSSALVPDATRIHYAYCSFDKALLSVQYIQTRPSSSLTNLTLSPITYISINTPTLLHRNDLFHLCYDLLPSFLMFYRLPPFVTTQRTGRHLLIQLTCVFTYSCWTFMRTIVVDDWGDCLDIVIKYHIDINNEAVMDRRHIPLCASLAWEKKGMANLINM